MSRGLCMDAPCVCRTFFQCQFGEAAIDFYWFRMSFFCPLHILLSSPTHTFFLADIAQSIFSRVVCMLGINISHLDKVDNFRNVMHRNDIADGLRASELGAILRVSLNCESRITICRDASNFSRSEISGSDAEARRLFLLFYSDECYQE